MKRLARVESRNVTYLAEDFPVFWERARGAVVRDTDGNSYLDLTAAFGVANLGHGHPAIRRAMAAQSAELWHGMGDVHPSRVKVDLLEALASIAPGRLSKSILSSSGAEAVESALKTARLATGKPGVLAFEGAYHGLTYGALTATQRPDFSTPFQDQLAPFTVHAPYPDSLHGPDEARCLQAVETIFRRAKGRLGAILVEPMQARGGIRCPGPEFLKGLRRLADRQGALLIADEIYTGFGRTGRMFAVEHAGIVPDLLCVGKALANGYPISACVGTAAVMDAWPVSDGEAIHTSTFLGNPLGCAMALAAIRETRRLRLADQARDKGRRWLAQLKAAFADHPRVGEVRGNGLMVGIELVADRISLAPNPRLAGRTVAAALQHGLIVLSGGNYRNVLTLTPPLTMTPAELTRATRMLQKILA